MLALPENMDISPDFERAYQLMEKTRQHIFLTGKAGTGKSTLLNYFRQNTKKKVVVLAPTGIAAVNIKGQTIHSFFGFPAHPIHSGYIKKRKDNKLYKSLDAIIIDEVSMVRADMLDAINFFMRLNGPSKQLPFGGVQMIFIGDLFQLPPVISSDVERKMFDFMYATPFFFSAHIIQQIELESIELKKVYRQNESNFIYLLDRVRRKRTDYDDLRVLNERLNPKFVPPESTPYITLCTTNNIAKKINDQRLKQLKAISYIFRAEINGDFNNRWLPNETELILKEGAQVMFLKNDAYRRWVNGTLGVINYMDEDTISVTVETEKGNVAHEVEPETWEIIRYDFDPDSQKITTEPIGSFKQYPIKPAWAITIHKSQGKTFNNIIIDMGWRGAFAPGQIYVALSRCTDIGGIVLRTPIREKDIIVDERILNFAREMGIYN